MKIRNGFISNSSSSSFIIIGNKKKVYPKLNNEGQLIINGEWANLRFGWTPEIHSIFLSRIVFTYIQAYYLKEYNKQPEYLEQLDKVLFKYIPNLKEVIWKNIEMEDALHPNFAYIDHQSASYEGENIEMFESDEKLASFLFCTDSYIKTDNDNY